MTNQPDQPQKEPPLLHRDDVPMDLAEDMVTKMKKAAKEQGMGDVKVQFIGDLTDEQKAKLPPGMMEGIARLHDKLVKHFVNGECHVCGKKFPGEWPPPEDGENYSLQDWSYYDSDHESHPPALACPECEEDEDGVPKPVELP